MAVSNPNESVSFEKLKHRALNRCAVHKLIHSYSIATGIVYFADDTKALFTPEAAAMVEKILYLMATRENNFQEVEIIDGLAVGDTISTKEPKSENGNEVNIQFK